MTAITDKEGRIIQFGIVIYWMFFWFLSSIDKLMYKSFIFWIGTDRITQFTESFASIGINNINFIWFVLIIFTIIEFLAFLFMLLTLIKLIKKENYNANRYFFKATMIGILIFSFFSIGDQFFGYSEELLEHTIYFVAIIISWGAYNIFSKLSKVDNYLTNK